MIRFLLALSLLLLACGYGKPQDKAPTETAAADPREEAVAGVLAQLRRLHSGARSEATPSRESLVELLGIDPKADRPLPQTRTRAALPDGDLFIQPLVYQAAPGIPVSALLWRPAGAGPFPAVLMTHGHFEAGKHAPSVQARCRELASAGVLVLAIDLFGQGERSALGHGNGAELHAAGSSLLALDVQSLVRGLDLLASRVDVDSSRLGLAGQSGGAIVAIHAAAIDARAVATFANSGLHDWEGAVLTVPHCACNYAPDQLRLGTVGDAAALVPPRALLACHGREDEYIPLASARAAQAGEAFELRERGGGHEFNEEARRAELAFFGQAFGLAPTTASTEGRSHEASTLSAFGPGGLDGDALSLSAIAAAGQRALRPATPLSEELLRERLAAVLALPERAPAATNQGGQLILETEPGLELRGWLSGAPSGPVLLVLDPLGGRAALAARSPLGEGQAAPGVRVLAVDLRGQGDSPGDRWDYLQLQVGAAAGAPLLGRRVHDARGWLAAARELAGEEAVMIRATGEAAMIAVLLAAVEPERFPSIPPVLEQLPATLFADPQDLQARWGLPTSLAVSGLAELGDVVDLFGALPLGAGADAFRAELRGLRARDGRDLSGSDPSWLRFREARAGRSPAHEGEDP